MTRSRVKGKHLNGAGSQKRKDIKEAIDPDPSGLAFHFGDVAWVKVGSYSWWPAQVTDDKSVSLSSKPRKTAESEVLVRLYGTYKYLYIDPAKNNEEFENMLKQSNISIREVLEKALEEDLSHIKGSHKTKKKLPQSGEMQDRTERNEEAKSVACGKHAQVGNLVNLEQDELKEKRLKEKVGNEEKKNQYGKQKSKQHVKRVEDDEVKEQNVAEKAGKSASNQRLEKKPKLTEMRGREVPKHNIQSQDSDGKSKQEYIAKNDKADIHGSGKHAQIGALESAERDGVMKQRVKERTRSDFRKNHERKHKSRQHDAAANLEQDEAKVRKVKQKTIHVATNQQSENEPKLAEKSGHGVSKHSGQTQRVRRKSKQSDVTMTDKTDVGESGKHGLGGNTCESSARRMKVMQSLGLIAPSGSPFCKHGPVRAASCES